ncbi:MAG: pteridine-dependent deoxygenase, partial [Pseudoxanthomonas sp.]
MNRPMSSLPTATPHARLDVDYVQADSPEALLQGDDVLAVLGFGNDAPRNSDPRYLRVPLQPYGTTPFEIWRTRSPVRHGRDGDIAWATDGQLSFGVIEVDEREIGIDAAAEQAYSRLLDFVGRSATPRLLRIW